MKTAARNPFPFDPKRAQEYSRLQCDQDGRPIRGELPDGTVETWEYDELGRLCIATRE